MEQPLPTLDNIPTNRELAPTRQLKRQLAQQAEKIQHLELLLKKHKEQIELAHLHAERNKQHTEIIEIYLANVLNCTVDHFYWLDKEGTVLACNQQQAKFFGLDNPSELVGKNIYDFLHKLKWERNFVEILRANNIHVMQTGKSEVKEELGFFEGNQFVFVSHKNPLLNNKGEIVGVFGYSIDITERKKAESMLLEATRQAEIERIGYKFRKQAEYYESLHQELSNLKAKLVSLETKEIYLNNFIQHAPGYFYWVDKQGTLLGCNQEQAHIFGFTKAEDFVGRNIYEMLYDLNWDSKDVEALRVNNLLVMAKGELQVTEERGFFDGQERIFLSHKCPLRNKEHVIIGIIGFSIEITERKNAELAAWEAREYAEKAYKAKTEFLENMRHDLRTPFGGIIGLAQNLEMQETDPVKKESLEWIVKSSAVVLDVLNDILAGANTSVTKEPEDYSVFCMQEVVTYLCNLLAAEIHRKQLVFTIDVDAAIPAFLVGDKRRLQRILLNLLANAVKFTERGSIQLDIKVVTQSPEQLNLLVKVKDTGIGIPQDKLDEIFENFVKLKPSFLSNNYAGVGVGLTITQNLVHELGGTIRVESCEGTGSTFSCLLPFDIPENLNTRSKSSTVD